jgi:hypothetical protein
VLERRGGALERELHDATPWWGEAPIVEREDGAWCR